MLLSAAVGEWIFFFLGFKWVFFYFFFFFFLSTVFLHLLAVNREGKGLVRVQV